MSAVGLTCGAKSCSNGATGGLASPAELVVSHYRFLNLGPKVLIDDCSSMSLKRKTGHVP